MNGIELPIATAEITPFRISVMQDAIDDLKTRLKATRFPTEQTVSDWSQGGPTIEGEEQRVVDSVNASLSEGFRQLHATRPQMIGYALADSPAGRR